MAELLSPAGTYEKMITAFDFGADAVYFAGQRFGLRAFAGNFSQEEIKKAAEYAHSIGKKVYVTLNIIAHETDFDGLEDYLHFLEEAKVDAVIVADVGIAYFVNKHSNLELHISTQANVLNSYSANFFADLGAKRIVLAREFSFEEIKKLKSKIPEDMELEVFVHGAMCISYSGRCLLSNYMTGRDSNRGACAQPCRWEYTVTEKRRKGNQYEIQEDERGTYVFNSKDMNLIKHINDLMSIGIQSFKIEGRMKSQYYVANVTNAYRRAIDDYRNSKDKQSWKISESLKAELLKSSHRDYTSGFMFNEDEKENIITSMPIQTHKFMALVLENHKDGKVLIEQRNRFKVGDVLEVLSPSENFNKKIKIEKMTNQDGEDVLDAKRVNEHLYVHTDAKLKKGEFLRIEYKN